MNYMNPFEYKEANKLDENELIDYYIEDFNYSRFIKSRRNIYLKGERGCGKTMTLLYNSFGIQKKIANIENKPNDLDIICVYVPCRTSLYYKKEWELLDGFKATMISEHMLVVDIMDRVVNTIEQIDGLLEQIDESKFIEQLSYAMDLEFPTKFGLFQSIRMTLQKEISRAQKALNKTNKDSYYDNLITFNTGLIPLFFLLKSMGKLAKTHFAIMIDDVQSLNIHQQKAINSWVAYRDKSTFSFKLASTKVDGPTYATSSEGVILEGHDFTTIDLERPYQNKYSSYGEHVKKIINKRLEKIRINCDADSFFPMNKNMVKDLEKAKDRVRQIAMDKYGEKEVKKISDFVYKNYRAEYFSARAKKPKANRPPYSGFETLVHISTGVVRQLLEPCYWMYDRVISQRRGGASDIVKPIRSIPSSIQTEIIMERSRAMWEYLRDSLDKSIDSCTNEQARHVYNLFNQLAILFRKRLKADISERRAVMFSISAQNHSSYNELMELIRIARKAQVLYTYTSSAKDDGQRESYYVPNRILWPEQGLDPFGLHARVSIRSADLLNAARNNIELPFMDDEEPGLFGDEG